MKKSLIALAVLAASGAAMAQSSVTLYGIVDLWVGSVKSETGATSKTNSVMVPGGVSTSRWGMKGSEDLGGGLKANFQLEQGFKPDDGSATAGFDRAAWVGFSGDFGAVRLGKVANAFDDINGASDSVFNSDLSAAVAPTGYTGTGVFRTFNDGGGKTSNNIYYQAPSVSGFSGAASYSLHEDSVTGTSVLAFNATYSAGPVAAQFGYQKNDKKASADDTAYTELGASYDLGVAKAKFTYGKVTNVGNVSGGNTTEWQLGADVPLSAAMTLSAGYAKSTDNATAAPTVGEVQRKGFGIGVAYGLSKRTTVYGGGKSVTLDNGTAADTKVTAFGVGIKHTF